MSAFAEFDKERCEIDSLLSGGYRIVRIDEDLDGASVTFAGISLAADTVVLRLGTADARKHVTSALLAAGRAGVPASAGSALA